MKNFHLGSRLMLASMLCFSGWAQAQFQKAFVHQSAASHIETFDVAENPDGFQVIGLHDGKQEIVYTDANGAKLNDRKFTFGSDFSQIDQINSKTMAVNENGITFLAGCSFPNLELLAIDASGAVFDWANFDLETHFNIKVHSVYEIELNNNGTAVFIHALLEHHPSHPRDRNHPFYHAVIKVKTDLDQLDWIADVSGSFEEEEAMLEVRDLEGKVGDMYPTAAGGVAYTGPMVKGLDGIPGSYIAALVLDAGGNTVWNNYYLEPETFEDNLEGTAIFESDEGETPVYYIGGFDQYGSAVLIETNQNGTLTWVRKYNTGSSEQERIIIRAIRKLEGQELLGIVGEHTTNIGSLAFAGRIQSGDGQVLNTSRFPDYQRCTDLLISQSGGYYAAAETRDDGSLQMPGLIHLNGNFATECSDQFTMLDYETFILQLERDFRLERPEPELRDAMFGQQPSDYEDEENCCSSGTTIETIVLCKGKWFETIGPRDLNPDNKYLWNNGSTNHELYVEGDGFYQLLTIDKNGCWGITNYIVQSSNITIDVQSIYPDPGNCTGEVIFNILISGVPPSSLYWQITNGGVLLDDGSTALGNLSTVLCSGVNTIHVQTSFGCEASIQVVAKKGAKEEELASDQALKLFPNPAANQITLEGLPALDAETQLRVVDLQGRTMLQGGINLLLPQGDGRYTLDVNVLENGNYFLDIRSNTNVVNERFTVLR